MGERVSIMSWCVGVPLAGSILLLMGAVEFKPPTVLATRVSIAPAGEPGTRMIVTGRVVDARDRPRAGIVIGIYQTDARGFYGKNTLAAPIARLHGWLKTDSLGRYELRTIRPGAYPTGGTPAHIHFIVDGRSEELRFAAGHALIAFPNSRAAPTKWMNPEPIAARAGGGDSFALYRPVKRDRAGVEHVVRDFRLR